VTVELSVKEKRYLLWGAIVLFFLCHLYYLNAPPNGYHHWRESDTMSMVANYYYEDMDFLYPRVNQRGNTTGITGSEFPIYQYIPAVLFNLFGFSHAIPRLLTVLMGCLAIWLVYKIVRLWSSETLAVFSAVAFAFSPLVFFYSYKIMPDITMLALMLGSFYAYSLFIKNARTIDWLLAVLLLLVAGAIKPTALMIYLPLLYLWFVNNRSVKTFVWYLLFVAISFGGVLGWFLFAKSINAEYGTTAFYMGHLLGDPRYIFRAQFFKKLFNQWPWELWIGWHFVILFAVGLIQAIKKRGFGLYFIWILGAYILFIIVAAHAASHDYYTLVAVPPVAVTTGAGLLYLYTRGRRWKTVALILILIAPIGVFIRVGDRLGETEEYRQIRAKVDEVIPNDALVMVRDNSNAIRLYQLNRKGWPLLRETQPDYVLRCIEKGGEYIILEEPLSEYMDTLTVYFDTTVTRLGPLYSYHLKK
jgi:4-amino-4-deoxy-L-arabinose transferase-like glycosyltransferase